MIRFIQFIVNNQFPFLKFAIDRSSHHLRQLSYMKAVPFECTLDYPGKKTPGHILSAGEKHRLVPSDSPATETGGPNGNILIRGDNLAALHALRSDRLNLHRYIPARGIPLICMDPPFATSRSFRGNDGHAYTDKKTGAAYMEFIRERLVLLRELLSDDGSIYVHLDQRMAHYIKVIMDELFGTDKFMNEIIWHYGSGGRAKRYFSRKHDTILVYGRTARPYFHHEAVGIPRGKTPRNHMKEAVDTDGRIYWSIKSAGREYRYYEDDLLTPDDVWDDISHLHQKDPQRVDHGRGAGGLALTRVKRQSQPLRDGWNRSVAKAPFTGSMPYDGFLP